MTIQGDINRKKIDDCKVEGDRLSLCGYHRDRAYSTVFGLTEGIEKHDIRSGIIHPTDHFMAFAEAMLRPERQPAGGWFLVKEQREWLESALVEILKKRDREEPVRILVAGIASYVHHFSYIIILQNVLKKMGGGFRLEITVADKCIYPLLTIAEIYRRGLDDLKADPVLRIRDTAVEIDPEFLRLADRYNLLDSPGISVDVSCLDLTDTDEAVALGRFDMVTEHFLTAVIENSDLLRKIRETYAGILKKGGALVCAFGLTRVRKEKFDKFMEMHFSYGFDFSGEKQSWDPYGMKRDDIGKLAKGETVVTYIDNSMIVFNKTG